MLGLAVVGGAIYSFINPVAVTKAFGAHMPSSTASTLSSPSTRPTTLNQSEAFQLAMIRVYGYVFLSTTGNPSTAHTLSILIILRIRNLSYASSLLGLIAFWKIGLTDRPLEAEVAKKCLGLMLMFGTITAVGDVWIVDQFAKCKELQEKENEEVKKAVESSRRGHGIAAAVILGLGASLWVL